MSKQRLVILAAVALVVGSFFLLRTPKPVIAIAPEPIFSIGSWEVTNTVFSGWVVVVLLVIGAYFIYRRVRDTEKALVPSGLQNIVEALYEAFFGIAEQVAGNRNARRFFPVVFTIFIFLLVGNWFGLFPWNNAIGPVENYRYHYLHEIEISVEEVVHDLEAGERTPTDGEIDAINTAFSDAYFTPIPFKVDKHDKADETIAKIRDGEGLGEVERAVRAEFAVNPIPAGVSGSVLIEQIEDRLGDAGVEDAHEALLYNLPLAAADAELVRAEGPIMSKGGFKVIMPRTIFDTPRDFSYNAFEETLLIEPGADGSVAQACLIACESQIGDSPPAAVPATVNTAHIGIVLRLEEQGFEDQTVGHIFPIFRAIATDLNLPLAIAIWSLIMVQVWGVRGVGAFNNFGKYLGLGSHSPVKPPIGVFIGLLELVSEIGRVISFTFRLFGNIFAGEVVLFISMFLVAFVVPSVFFGLEIFVGFIQAFVFAMLTLVFAAAAVAGHDEEHGHGEGDEAAAH